MLHDGSGGATGDKVGPTGAMVVVISFSANTPVTYKTHMVAMIAIAAKIPQYTVGLENDHPFG